MSQDSTNKSAVEEVEQTGESIGEKLAHPFVLMGAFVASILVGILVGISRRIPGRGRIQRWMVNTGIEGMWRTSGSHLITFTIYGDRAVVPRPASVNTEDGKIETNNGEEWTVTDIQTYRFGDAPVAFGVADDHELASPVAARVAEAVDHDWNRVQTVKEDEDGIKKTDYVSPQAVADGGGHVREPFDDVWIDATNPLETAKGWIVSMKKGYEMHWSQSSADEMKKQEDRGRLSEMDPNKYDNRALKLVIIFGAGLLLGLFGPALAVRVAGEAASGGSAIPMMLETLFVGVIQ